VRRLILLCVAGGFALAAAAVFLTYLYEKPSALRVAVVRGSEDHEVMAAAAQDLIHERESIRLNVQTFDSLLASAAALDHGKADLAVVRSDVEMPTNGQTILILHRSAVLFLASAEAGIRSIADLRGRKLGIVFDHKLANVADPTLLRTILDQYAVPISDVTTINLPESEVERALASKRVDAIMALGAPGSNELGAVVTSVTRASDGKPIFIPIPEAEGIAQRSPNYEAVEIVRGLFPGAAPQPADSFQTLGVSTRLVARSSLNDSVAGDLTRILLQARPRLALRAPLAARIVAPPTDKGALLPIHPGAAAFLDDESESFFEKYGDFFYIGAMVLSVLGSALAALASRISQLHGESQSEAIARLLEILKEAREASQMESLQALEAEADTILAKSLKSGRPPNIAALSLMMEQVRCAIADRHERLGSVARAPGFEPRLVKD